ncbi:PqqD family protein [Microbacterium sp. E-13]|uniref:PqqD family protein n=1 Tax=Microbacterium sp. E-13 TaxID=3404048 RepID=UPI003CF6E816
MAATAYDDSVYVAHLPDGPIQILEGTAALIWSHALSVPRSRLAAAVADDVEGDPATVRAEVVAFVDALIRQGLLVEDDT